MKKIATVALLSTFALAQNHQMRDEKIIDQGPIVIKDPSLKMDNQKQMDIKKENIQPHPLDENEKAEIMKRMGEHEKVRVREQEMMNENQKTETMNRMDEHEKEMMREQEMRDERMKRMHEHQKNRHQQMERRGKDHGKHNMHDQRHDEWNGHHGHHGDRKHPHHLFYFALFFIIVGIIISKIARKICKKRKRCQQKRMRNSNSMKIKEEIEKQEEVLSKLKTEYERKRAEESRISFRQSNQMPQPVPIVQYYQPQQFSGNNFGYYQNYPRQQQEQVPMGRPIKNEGQSYPNL